MNKIYNLLGTNILDESRYVLIYEIGPDRSLKPEKIPPPPSAKRKESYLSWTAHGMMHWYQMKPTHENNVAKLIQPA